jgi:hypothetical protein
MVMFCIFPLPHQAGPASVLFTHTSESCQCSYQIRLENNFRNSGPIQKTHPEEFFSSPSTLGTQLCISSSSTRENGTVGYVVVPTDQ